MFHQTELYRATQRMFTLSSTTLRHDRSMVADFATISQYNRMEIRNQFSILLNTDTSSDFNCIIYQPRQEEFARWTSQCSRICSPGKANKTKRVRREISHPDCVPSIILHNLCQHRAHKQQALNAFTNFSTALYLAIKILLQLFARVCVASCQRHYARPSDKNGKFPSITACRAKKIRVAENRVCEQFISSRILASGKSDR